MANEVINIMLSKDIQKNLYPDNEAYKMSVLDTPTPDSEVVEIPQDGGVPTVVTNPTTFPLPVNKVDQNKKTYNITYFATNPTLVTDVNEIRTVTNKRQRIAENQRQALQSNIAETILNSWCPSALTTANAKQTSGSTSRAASATGTTGNRKKVTLTDLAQMQFLLDKQDVPAQDRYAVFPASMYNDLVVLDGYINYTDRKAQFGDLLAKGFVGEIYGFKVMKRSFVLAYSENADITLITKRAVDATLSATDNEAAIFWHKSFVRRAEGYAKVYTNTNRAEYQGTLISSKVLAGGTAGRNDGKGVVVLLQDNA